MGSRSERFGLEVKPVAKIQLLLAVVEDLRALADSVQAVANAMMEGDPPAEAKEPEQAAASTTKPDKPKKSAPVITLEQVRAVLVDKTHDGFTAEVQALLKKYGASKLSAIDSKHYAALLKDAEGIGHVAP